MTRYSKFSILLVIAGLTLQDTPAFAEASGASSESKQPNPKAAANQTPASSSTNAKPSQPAPGSPTSAGSDSSLPKTVIAPRGPALFKLLDTDGDGRVSPSEFTAYATPKHEIGTPASKSASPNGAAPANSPSGPTGKTGSNSHGSSSNKTNDSSNSSGSSAGAESSSPGAGILTSTDTRAGRYTPEVFRLLDINHDHYLTQSELDALTGSHNLSQP